MKSEEILEIAAQLLAKIDTGSACANDIVNNYTKSHKYIEAEDRKLLLDYVWRAIRAKARLNYAYPDSTWQEKLSYLLTKGIPQSPDMPKSVQWEVQDFILDRLPNPELELPALLEPAPIVLRANGNRDKILQEAKEEGLDVSPAPTSPFGVILNQHTNLKTSKLFKKGLLEVQDEGAQLLSLEIGVKPKDSVFDFCAGAGGKSLIFAQIMNNKGLIMAYDASFKRLSELSGRAKRAKVSIIKTVTRLPETFKKFDHVVVDAPCTGTGTWRRSPDLRWSLTEKQIKNITKTQAEILSTAQEYVKNGHFLTYITCSLLYDEDEKQVEAFLKKYKNFRIVKEKRYSPYLTKTDGFYLCVMQKQ